MISMKGYGKWRPYWKADGDLPLAGKLTFNKKRCNERNGDDNRENDQDSFQGFHDNNG